MKKFALYTDGSTVKTLIKWRLWAKEHGYTYYIQQYQGHGVIQDGKLKVVKTLNKIKTNS